MADAGLEHQVNAFPMLAKSETLMKRHVDRTRKLDPGACASQPLPNALAQARIIAELRPHVHLRSLHAGDSGWLLVHVQVGASRVFSEYCTKPVTIPRGGARVTLAVACRRCDRFICSVSPRRGISFELPASRKRRNFDRRNL